MKKYISNVLLTFVLVFIFSSCTHNNGDIGPLFGNWKITSIEINGKTDAGYKGNMFMAFQNNVVTINEVREDEYYYNPCFGSWSQKGNDITFFFNVGFYTPPEGLYFTRNANICHIESLSSSKFVFTYINNDTKYKYHLVKW